jgi:hypothetical protein
MKHIHEHIVLCSFFRWFRPRFLHTANQGGKILSSYVSKMNPRKYGHSGDFATSRLDEQELAALSLHLLQICLVYVLSHDFSGIGKKAIHTDALLLLSLQWLLQGPVSIPLHDAKLGEDGV